MPFERVEPFIPAKGKILDFGCGFGNFAIYLKLKSPEREIMGTDLDEKKIEIARSTGADVHFSTKDIFNVKERFDAVVFIDVLYLIEPEQQNRILKKALELLNPGGKLLIKAMANRPRWKHWWNLSQDFLFVKILRWNEGEGFFHRYESDYGEVFKELSLNYEVHRIDQGYPHPHVLYVARRN